MGKGQTWFDFQENQTIFGLPVAKKLSKIGQKWGFRSIKSKFLNQSSCNFRLLFLGVRARLDLIFKKIEQFLALPKQSSKNHKTHWEGKDRKTKALSSSHQLPILYRI